MKAVIFLTCITIISCSQTQQERDNKVMPLDSAYIIYESKCASCHTINLDLEDIRLKSIYQLRKLNHIDSISKGILTKHSDIEDLKNLSQYEVFGVSNYIMFADSTPLSIK